MEGVKFFACGVLLLTAAVLIGACSRGTLDPSIGSTVPIVGEAEPRVGSAVEPDALGELQRTTSSASEFVFPLEDLLYASSGDRVALKAAQFGWVEECMTALGWEWIPPPIEGMEIAVFNRYGNETVERIDNPLKRVSSSDGPPVTSAPLSPEEEEAWTLALLGADDDMTWVSDYTAIPRSGCVAEANSRLYGDYGNYRKMWDEMEDWVGRAAREAVNSASVRDALDAWVVCMSEQGYGFQSPTDLGLLVPETPVETRQADVQCKERTRLIEIWAAAEVLAQERYAEKHASEIEAWLELRSDAVQRAYEAFGGDPG